MTALGEITLDEAAKEAAGNWQDFTCFWWCRKKEIENPENWAIIYSHHRDSGLLDQSNAEVIAEALKPFSDTQDPDVVFESHSHWLVGHIDGFSVRVFKDGEITAAFRRYHELATSLAHYPVLDDTDYSNREYEATLENIPIVAWRLEKQYDLPDDWVAQTFDWLWQHDQSAVENVDDQGGYPSEEQLVDAFTALGFARTE